MREVGIHDTIVVMKWCCGIYVFLFILLGVLYSLPSVFAAENSLFEGVDPNNPDSLYVDGGLVPAGTQEYAPDGYGTCELVQTVNNVMRFLIAVSILVAVVVFIYAGYLMVYSRGDSTLIAQAKSLFANILIGVVILLSAYLVINTVLSILAGGPSAILNWQTIECSYAYRAGQPDEYEIILQKDLLEYDESGVATNYRDTAVGGSCETLNAGRCSVSNLKQEGLFAGNEEAASRVCNKESGGTSQWSGTDLCKDGTSFSGGWYQINIISNAKSIPGCAGAFKLYGSGAQGGCLERRTNSAGVTYCAKWNCAVQDVAKYNACKKAVEDWDVNSSIANQLYENSGKDFTDWKISAGLCNAPY